MENHMNIRPASKKDIPQLADLMEQLGYPSTIDEMESRYTSIEEDSHYHTLVAELDGKVAGMQDYVSTCSMNMMDSMCGLSPLWWIHTTAVEALAKNCC